MALRCSFFFFNDTAPTEIYTLSLHDALPIWLRRASRRGGVDTFVPAPAEPNVEVIEHAGLRWIRSEEHTSELQSHVNLVCRLLLEKKKKKTPDPTTDETRSAAMSGERGGGTV